MAGIADHGAVAPCACRELLETVRIPREAEVAIVHETRLIVRERFGRFAGGLDDGVNWTAPVWIDRNRSVARCEAVEHATELGVLQVIVSDDEDLRPRGGKLREQVLDDRALIADRVPRHGNQWLGIGVAG